MDGELKEYCSYTEFLEVASEVFPGDGDDLDEYNVPGE